MFEAIIQGCSPHQRLILQALAKEPTGKILSSSYMQRHTLGSVGGVQYSVRQLSDMDLIERGEGKGPWHIVDPVFAMWIKRQAESRV